MFASAKNILLGEDLSSDPVSKTIGLVLRFFTHGHVVLDVQLFSQVTELGALVTGTCLNQDMLFQLHNANGGARPSPLVVQARVCGGVDRQLYCKHACRMLRCAGVALL